ncbi:unnamed protein product [Arctogadus glacialis]
MKPPQNNSTDFAERCCEVRCKDPAHAHAERRAHYQHGERNTRGCQARLEAKHRRSTLQRTQLYIRRI